MTTGGRIPPFGRALILAAFALLITDAPVLCQDSQPSAVVAIVSNRIRPYADALAGLRETLAGEEDLSVRDYWLNDYPAQGRSALGEAVAAAAPALVVTIGPEALVFAQTLEGPAVPLVYAVVLGPERLLKSSDDVCGVSLNIPVGTQFREILRVLPDVKRVGLLFDPANNQTFLDEAQEAAGAYGIDIVALSISAMARIPAVLEGNWDRVDGLWMIPDKTVISERIVQYIIRESIIQKKPVIGFNRFFHESGAVVSFEFDYRDLGAQAGEIVLDRLGSGVCVSREPLFGRLVNTRVAEKIGVRTQVPEEGESR
jgi:putative ABC transport system substrate-binding protein